MCSRDAAEYQENSYQQHNAQGCYKAIDHQGLLARDAVHFILLLIAITRWMCSYAAYHKIDAEAVNISLLTVYMAKGYKASVESPVFVHCGGGLF
jgi:hypothetical protein